MNISRDIKHFEEMLLNFWAHSGEEVGNICSSRKKATKSLLNRIGSDRHEVYDLKGTTEDRWVDPEVYTVLKDNNLAFAA